MVAAVQSSILLGAAFGGSLLDHFGITATFLGSAVASGIALIVIGSGRKLLKPRQR